MAGEVFKKYYSRLAREGVIKSLMFGLIIGFSAMLVTALALWLSKVEAIWIAAIVFVVTTAIATPVLYSKKFKPTTKAMAMRLDSLGLQERLITMTELEGDSSFMAMKQREDAMATLSKVDGKMIKFAVSLPLIVTLAVLTVISTGATTTFALVPLETLQEQKVPSVYSVKYTVNGNGVVLGTTEQTITEGENGTAVFALADTGWMFTNWSDGVINPYRLETKVSADADLQAFFVKVDDDEVTEGNDDVPEEGDGESDSNGDKGSFNKPQDMQSGQNSPPPEGDDGDGEGGGRYDPNNQIIDGETFYGGNMFDDAYAEAMAQLASNGEIPDYLKKIIADYFATISK